MTLCGNKQTEMWEKRSCWQGKIPSTKMRKWEGDGEGDGERRQRQA